LTERERLFFFDFFHRERKSAIFEEFFDPLEGLDIENDPDPPVVLGYDILPFDVDHRLSPLSLSRIPCIDILGERSDKC